jgi:hypothetical protein
VGSFGRSATLKGRILAIAALCAIVGGACAAASGAGADEAEIADGIITDANHDGMPGIVMYLYASATPDKGTGKSILVAKAKSDESGSFAMTAANTAALERLAKSNDGWLNLDYVGGLRTLHVYRSVPRKFVDGKWIGTEDQDFSSSLGEVGLYPGAPGVGGRKAYRSFSGAAEEALDCTETSSVSRQANIVTTIGELHTSDTTAALRYGPTADSTIDAFVSWNGGASWSPAQIGPTHVANAFGSSITQSATTSYGKTARTKFVFKKIRYVNTCYGEHYLVKASKWVGSSVVGSTALDPTSNCSSVDASNVQTFTGSFTRSANTAGKYRKAASLSPLAVPKFAGAVSGYSGNMKATWSASSGTHTLCGDTSGPSTSLHIYAG